MDAVLATIEAGGPLSAGAVEERLRQSGPVQTVRDVRRRLEKLMIAPSRTGS